MSTIISSVIISAQTTDLILIAIFNWTGNCHLHPAALPVHSSRTPPNSKCAFNEGDTSLCNMPRVAGLSACFHSRLALHISYFSTGALEIYPHPGLVDVREASLHASPFGSSLVISLGFVIVLLVAVPFGYWNLDDNIKLQIGTECNPLLVSARFWFHSLTLLRRCISFHVHYDTGMGRWFCFRWIRFW